MPRTPEKLVELYLQWRSFSFPEWARDRGIDVPGITTQDPATRHKLALEGQQLVDELKRVQRENKADDIDIDVRLCIDDGDSTISNLRSESLSVRELLELVAPDPDEEPWIENRRWLLASQTMPRALARAQASGPWIRDVLTTIASELEEASQTRDPVRRHAAEQARTACLHLAHAVGYRPLAKQPDELPPGTMKLARKLIEQDRRRLEVALSNVAPGLIPESAMGRISEEVIDRGRVLGLAEGWRDTLKDATERSGWAPIPPHGEPSFGIMTRSRSYTSANLRSVTPTGASVMLALPTNNVTLPLTIAHETYPGHLLQRSYQRRATTRAMQLLSSPTSDEGWAHYAEMRIHELGVGEPRAFEVGLAQRSLLRSARLFARAGIVSGRMDATAALKIFKETVLLGPEAAKREADRVRWDHKVVDYSIGRRAIEQMEEEFVGRGMGDANSFRMRVLPIMVAPMDMIAKRLGLKKPDVL